MLNCIVGIGSPGGGFLPYGDTRLFGEWFGGYCPRLSSCSKCLSCLGETKAMYSSAPGRRRLRGSGCCPARSRAGICGRGFRGPCC
jgi:hypothetical protein